MAKKFLIACVFLFVGAGFSGCTNYNRDETIEYPWPIILIMKYELKTETVPMEALNNLSSQIEWDIYQSGTTVQIEMYFENFAAFAELFHVEQFPVSVVQKQKLFFIERTIKFQNPLSVAPLAPIDALNQKVAAAYTTYLNDGYNLYYVLESQTRRSRLDAAYKSENKTTHYLYYFKPDAAEIEIFDRFANQPIWYALALVGTGAFMAICYGILKSRRKSVDNTFDKVA
jgi:hypothetical protein